MTAVNVAAWIPEDPGSAVIQRVNQISAVERLARRVNMTSLTKSEPRSAGMGVEVIDKSAEYGEDASANDEVVLTAVKFGKALRIAEEDLNDSLPNVIATKQADWATSYAKLIDNACLATAGAVGAGRPFTSVYEALESEQIVQTGNGQGTEYDPPTYDELSQTLSIVEGGDYWDDSSMVLIAHPVFRSYLRGVKDNQGMPVFVQGLAGTPDTVFGHEVTWSLGARKSTTASAAPDGNPLLIAGNRDLLILGARSGPESVFIDGRSGLSALTDEAILKMRARRGFAVGRAEGFAALEIQTSD